MNTLVIFAVVAVVCIVCALVLRWKHQKEMGHIVDSMLSAKSQEMRQRFLSDSDDMEFTFLVVSQRNAGKILKSVWQKMAERYPNASWERLWTLELQLASEPVYLAGEGENHLVWAVVRVERETVSVKVRQLEPSLFSPDFRQMVKKTAEGLVSALQKRKCEVSLAVVKNQPDLGSLTVIPTK
jgi:hypothetical protein